MSGMFGLIVIVVIVTSIWAVVDSKGRGMINPFVLLVGLVLLWIVVFPVYLAERGKYPPRPIDG
jgi:hypothetical protein